MKHKSPQLSKQDILNLGFSEIVTFNIGNSLTYDLGRKRYLSISNIDNPNQMLAIGELEDEMSTKVIDIIIIHNYDYDGYISREKLEGLIKYLTL